MAKVGRPKGSVKPRTVPYYRLVRPEFIEIMDSLLNQLRQEAKAKDAELKNYLKSIYK